MFSLVNGVYDNYLAPTQINLLIVGPSGVGKTALLERLKVTQFPKRPRQQPSLSLAPLPPLLEETLVPEDDDDDEEDESDDGNKIETTTTSTHASTTADDKEAGNSTTQRPKMNLASSSSSLSKTTPRKNSHRRSSSHSFSPTPSVVVTQAQRRGLVRLLCPAPKRYHDAKGDQDEEFVPYDNNSITSHGDDENSTTSNNNDETPPRGRQRSPTQGRQRSHSKEFNVDEALEINGGGGAPSVTTQMNGSAPKKTSISNMAQVRSVAPKVMPHSSLFQANDKEVDRKPSSKMFPLKKIRPTIGTNLGKIHMYGAQVNLFDVGGKMHNSWDKYYDDCDGVVFCWKLGGDSIKDDEDDEEEDKNESLDATKQQEILQQVRKSIPDDVPFLVFGHIFGNANILLTDKIYGTNILLPHYHNPMTGLCCGSAKTGVGFQSAMEWLVPLAKRQQKERLSRKESSLPKTI
mmetsp:Transcript_5232/g.12517  ORF Transcript_5232/g.12517 Transcript_5232/m.12517 type:complete len:462 (-) Transcript_5232:84-1469(-)